MINLRYHLISIVAVFLALGIGVVMGSTVVDRVIVDTLEGQVNRYEDDLEREQAARATMSERLDALEDQQRSLTEEGGPLLQGRLKGVPVLVVAARGVDDAPVARLREALTEAGARDQGVYWLDAKLALDSDDVVTQLADALGVTPAAAADPASLQRSVARRLANVLNAQGAAPRSVEAVEGAPRSGSPRLQFLLRALVEAGFADYDEGAFGGLADPQVPLAGSRYIVVSGVGAELVDEAVVLPMLAVMASVDEVSVVAAESFPAQGAAPRDGDGDGDGDGDIEAPARGVFVGKLRGDNRISAAVSTIDDIEAFPGLAAAVLALADLPRGSVGHYGVGEGADRLLPVSAEP